MDARAKHVYLKEQIFRPVLLPRQDSSYLTDIGFQVEFTDAKGDTGESEFCLVNPRELVGHFRLPSGRIAVIEPKIAAANVFRMLAYIYTAAHERFLRPETVEYARETFLFEPLVIFFNSLVANRVRRGLVQDYIRLAENLGSFRGALHVSNHILHNLGRDNAIYCRYFEQTVDIDDNRIIKSTLHRLLQMGCWTRRTTLDLISNAHQFDAVSLALYPHRILENRHYHRLNEDYQPIHALCKMFLDCSSISEKIGDLDFNGFLLDMNVLFEQFVQQVFEAALRHKALTIAIQKPELLSSIASYGIEIRPDVVIRDGLTVAAIVDAKYKKDAAGPKNPDTYQVITYGTVLECPRTYLLYPQTEVDSEHDIPVKNSGIVVRTRRVDISASDCVQKAEAVARAIISEREPAHWQTNVA
jgi:5-methylcytosine-specific restriction enzyme subunit McrC